MAQQQWPSQTLLDFISTSEDALLVMQASLNAVDGVVFLLDMGVPVRIEDYSFCFGRNVLRTFKE